MKKNSDGSVLVIMIFLTMALFLFVLVVANVGQAALTEERAQTLADVSVLSSVRLRAEALETVAGRWMEFGKFFSEMFDAGTAQLASVYWQGVQTQATALRKALPGYQGRTTAVVKVLAEANGITRDQVDIADDAGSKLGLSGEKAWVVDETGARNLFTDIWLRRLWSSIGNLGDDDKSSRHRVLLTVPLVFGFRPIAEDIVWKTSKISSARIRWDAPKDNPQLYSTGNGGYPFGWNDAIDDAGRFNPNRWAAYRATLSADQP